MSTTETFEKPRGKRPAYFAKMRTGDGYWLTIGAAWTFTTKNGEEAISLRLQALPPSGDVALFPAADIEVPDKQLLEDDEIPF